MLNPHDCYVPGVEKHRVYVANGLRKERPAKDDAEAANSRHEPVRSNLRRGPKDCVTGYGGSQWPDRKT